MLGGVFFGAIIRLEVQALLDSLDLLLGSLGAALVIGSALKAGILHLGIELNLWLGT